VIISNGRQVGDYTRNKSKIIKREMLFSSEQHLATYLSQNIISAHSSLTRKGIVGAVFNSEILPE